MTYHQWDDVYIHGGHYPDGRMCKVCGLFDVEGTPSSCSTRPQTPYPTTPNPQADEWYPFERWSGYEEQSWQERFNTLDAEHSRLCKQMVDSAVSQAARITADRARIEQLEALGAALVAKIDAMVEATTPIFAEREFARGIAYDGPQIGEELEAFRTALTSGRGG